MMTDERIVRARHGRRLRRIIVAMLLLAALAGAGGSAWWTWAVGGTATGAKTTVEVPSGASAAAIADLLADADVIRSAVAFRISARSRGVAGDLKPGVYTLREGLGVTGVLDLLRKGIEPEVFRFTIPEGKTVREIAAIVAKRTTVSAASFVREAESGRHRIDIMPKGVKSLEGLLFPKTYDVRKDATAADIIKILLRQFEKETAGIDLGAKRSKGVSPYEAVIIASLIEREARVASEQRTVSSVIYNRLARPMRLQIDATIQYVYLQRNGRVKEPLTFADYKLDSRYNTYRIDGLPPTPIAAPGLGALRASVNPSRTPYYYYVLINERGEHCFSETKAQHDACRRRAP